MTARQDDSRARLYARYVSTHLSGRSNGQRRLHTGQHVTREDKARAFRQARGVLNNLHSAEMDSVNCRMFEAAAAGGAVLCECRNSLAELFAEGSEVFAFD